MTTASAMLSLSEGDASISYGDCADFYGGWIGNLGPGESARGNTEQGVQPIIVISRGFNRLGHGGFNAVPARGVVRARSCTGFVWAAALTGSLGRPAR